MTADSYAQRVEQERIHLAVSDPGGESEAVSPVDIRAAMEWKRGLERSLDKAGFVGPDAEDRYLAAMRGWTEQGAAAPFVPRPTLGTRTAADLSHGTPPDQLVDRFLTPEGATVAYARGGTGKGLISCYLISRLVRAGHVVMVLDFEGHEREWGSRLRGLGMTEEELGQVHYRAPFGSEWTAPTGSLSAVAKLIRDDAVALGVTYLIVDSYSPATSNGDTMGGEQAAREYFAGLTRIGCPSLTIAHVRGDSAKFPDRPFGSVFVHNYARETWAVERVDDPEPDLDEYAPRVVALELRNKKANGREIAPVQFLTFSFYADGTIDADASAPTDRPVAELVADVLAEGAKTPKDIVSAIREDTGRSVSEETVSRKLRRFPRRFRVVSETRPRKWGLVA